MIAAKLNKRRKKDKMSKHSATTNLNSPREHSSTDNFVESLEARIAPASFAGALVKNATFGEPILLKANEVLTSGGGYMLGVEKGQALVYLTDLNHNGVVDSNEITGISAGDGLRLTAFADINGDIVTNLNPNGTLTDFDPATPGNDGRVVLNSKIESLTFRTVTAADVPASVGDFQTKLIASTFSLYGNIFAGGGFGTTDGGLVIDTHGWTLLTTKFDGDQGVLVEGDPHPSVGNIYTGTAVSGHVFSFGVAGKSTDLHGALAKFTPAAGQLGGDIIRVRVGDNADSSTATFTPAEFSIGGLYAGNGGAGARGGDIRDVTLFGDTGTFHAIAGNGGDGSNGGLGGSVVNLSDLGSHISNVVIQTGSGGTGVNGKGGDGGTLTLGAFSTTGNVTIDLGDGGNGTTAGGKGSGLQSASFTPIGTEIGIPFKVVSTYRNAGDVGTPLQIDFNGDGIGDIVYISQNPNQLVVKLGVETGGSYGITDSSPTIYLDAPRYDSGGDVSSALVVADFDGDDDLDIATASSVKNSRDGLYVYLWNDVTKTFDAPLRSEIPFLAPVQSGGAITDMVAGDFDFDGKMDIAYVGQYISDVAPRVNLTNLVIMSGTGDGLFYVNYGEDSHAQTFNPILELAEGVGANGHPEFILEATAIKQAAIPAQADIMTVLRPNNGNFKAITGYQYGLNGEDEIGEVFSVVGQVQNRSWEDGKDGAPGNIKFDTAVDVTAIDYTILDINNDGFFDIISLNQNGYLVAFKGSVNIDGEVEVTQPDNGRGILLTGEFGVLGAKTDNLNDTFKEIVTGDFDADGNLDIGIYSVSSATNIPLAGLAFDVSAFKQEYKSGQKAPLSVGITSIGSTFFVKPDPLDDEIIVFTAYQGNIANSKAAWGFAIGTPQSAKYDSASIQTSFANQSALISSLSTESFAFSAGDGGDSQLGIGGAGGSFGKGVLTAASGEKPLNGSINFTIPGFDVGFSALFQFSAGSGGNGLKGGGDGGSISGIAGRFSSGPLASTFELFAGDGGNSTQGKGGAGGGISKLSIESLSLASAGDGGEGITGGNGGNVSGNGIASLYDTSWVDVQLFGGNGGRGISAGGQGGNISNLKAEFRGSGGLLNYVAGDGGDAIGGKGGNGGSIQNLSPAEDNTLQGPVNVKAGDGGNGLAGGHGGSITTLRNDPAFDTLKPISVSFIAGNGGWGISQNGGNGGSLTDILATASSGDFFLRFNRFLAGNGGDSFGAAGGNGGSITNLNTSADSISIAIAAGAGGDGLTKGGNGGNVSTVTSAASGFPSKNLVIAGAGGDAFAFTEASITASIPAEQKALLAFGGVNSVGGNGGSINGFNDGGADIVTDLIAGNGGSLVNYGSPNQKTNVGKGGSVSNITLNGSAGDLRANQAIRSYNEVGESMADFVSDFLAADFTDPLTNSVGNVGVVVGAAGRVANDLASSNTLNGSVTNFTTTKGIMSMVAGSVNRVSAILALNNITVATGGVIGAYKDGGPVHNPSTPLYYTSPDKTSTSGTLVSGGALLDGGILTTKNNTSLSSIRLFTT